ncbi:MAG: tRNA (adenosine(37)-N6)-threonylcarbamoyltransferase complex transferase subunit TsaD [Clostridia bacterium]|nr:tRNA (adenosine(37)-N6)-threonylcarbamoyltransferase complex transferase subunit TsaD [Clostridia bacterium]
MYILGLESSCDETSAAIVEIDGEKRRICSNIIASQIDIHRLYGGVVPEIAGRAHIEAVTRITHEALESAGLDIRDIGLCAVTSHPGLIGALLVGVNFAKSLAFANNIPLVGVNHVMGHIAAAYLEYEWLKPPFLGVVLSGGHTSFYVVRDYVDFEEIGSTRDDAAGEAFDKIGRVIGLPYPGGAALDKLAYEGNKKAYKLPSPALSGDTLDFSFSGLKTAALNLINTAAQKGETIDRADLAASFTGVIADGFSQKLSKAIEQTGLKTVVVAGGVSANSHLRAAAKAVCDKYGATLCLPPLSLCGDNAAMIATQGYYDYKAGKIAGTDLNASAI